MPKISPDCLHARIWKRKHVASEHFTFWCCLNRPLFTWFIWDHPPILSYDFATLCPFSLENAEPLVLRWSRHKKTERLKNCFGSKSHWTTLVINGCQRRRRGLTLSKSVVGKFLRGKDHPHHSTTHGLSSGVIIKWCYCCGQMLNDTVLRIMKMTWKYHFSFFNWNCSYFFPGSS